MSLAMQGAAPSIDAASGPGSLWDDVRPETSRRLLVAALESFAEHGFHATTTRDIAERAGMSPAAVYIHYPSKAAMLEQISRTGHEAALREIEAALSTLEGDHVERLRRFVEVFAGWHARNHMLARVVQHELRALPRDAHEQITALRGRIEELVQLELRRGEELGAFEVGDVRATALAILSLCIDIARWYRPRSDRTPEEIAVLYGDLALRMVRRTR